MGKKQQEEVMKRMARIAVRFSTKNAWNKIKKVAGMVD